jgi:hypothetical protein
MKVYAMVNDGCFKIHLSSENQEESHMIVGMSESVRCPVASYGYVDKNSTWAWFFIPIRQGTEYSTGRFGNKKY